MKLKMVHSQQNSFFDCVVGNQRLSDLNITDLVLRVSAQGVFCHVAIKVEDIEVDVLDFEPQNLQVTKRDSNDNTVVEVGASNVEQGEAGEPSLEEIFGGKQWIC